MTDNLFVLNDLDPTPFGGLYTECIGCWVQIIQKLIYLFHPYKWMKINKLIFKNRNRHHEVLPHTYGVPVSIFGAVTLSLFYE
tara:strand:+ start:26 stop:274 length:249 start_codon:yes stop_codon:yes gene_type:complete